MGQAVHMSVSTTAIRTVTATKVSRLDTTATASILPRRSRLDVSDLGTNGCNPISDGLSNELRPIV